MITQEVGEFFSNTITGLQVVSMEGGSTKVIMYSTYGAFEDDTIDTIESFPVKDIISVNYEDNKLLHRGRKITKEKEAVDLSEDEMLYIKNWIKEYFTKEGSYPDIYVSAYDPNDHNLYQGNLLLSEVKKNNFFFTTVPCEYSVAKYDELEDKWEEVVTIIQENGYVIHRPDSYCVKCVIFLTQEELDNYPTIPEDLFYSPYLRWDFVKENWKDARTIKDCKENYINTITERFNSLLDEQARYYLNISYGNASRVLTYIVNNYQNQDNYNYGVQCVIDEFKVRGELDVTPDFSDEFLVEQYLASSKVISGQRDAWLALPNKIMNTTAKYNLSIPHGWDRLLDKFEEWYKKVYEYEESK